MRSSTFRTEIINQKSNISSNKEKIRVDRNLNAGCKRFDLFSKTIILFAKKAKVTAQTHDITLLK